MKIFKKNFEFGKHTVTLETGEIARQSLGSVTVTMGDTVVLVTTTAKKEINEDINFFPLTINYQEKTYSAGKIPGGFPRREGKPSEIETLTSRLIDRPIRPLFPEDFYHEVNIFATVLSFDPEVPPDIPAMIGASTSLMLSGLPFKGPLAAARIGFISGEYILNPTFQQFKDSELNLIVAGTKDSVLMVEAEAMNLPEDVVLGAILYGHVQMQVAINAIIDLKKHAANSTWTFSKILDNKILKILKERIINQFYKDIEQAYYEIEKKKRNEILCSLRKKVIMNILNDLHNIKEVNVMSIEKVFYQIEKDLVRKNILEGKPRIDGRDTRTVRPIAIKNWFFTKNSWFFIIYKGRNSSSCSNHFR